MTRIQISSTEVQRDWRTVQNHLIQGDQVVVVHYRRPVAVITAHQEETVLQDALIDSFRIVVPNEHTAGYTPSSGVDCSELWGRYVVESGEEYQADFDTLPEAMAYVRGRVDVPLGWDEVPDGRGIDGWDPRRLPADTPAESNDDGDDEDTSGRRRFTTDRDAKNEIMTSLEGSEGTWDGDAIDAIFRKAYKWKIDVNEKGQELLNTGGFEQVVSTDEFWEIAASHDSSDQE